MNGVLAKATDPEDKALDRNRNDVKTLQGLISRYVGQLLDGCGHATCEEIACATGRRNTSRGPVRDYTPRSARTIAITLASGLNPRLRLCRNYLSQQPHGMQKLADRQRDPSAFSQHLSDTASIRKACSPPNETVKKDEPVRSTGTAPYDQVFNERLQQWHKILNGYLSSFVGLDKTAPPSSNLDQTVAIADNLYECIKWLAGTLPKASDRVYFVADHSAQNGYSYPIYTRDNDYNKRGKTTQLQDDLNYEPSLRLFTRVIEVVAESSAREPDASHNDSRSAHADRNDYPVRPMHDLLSRRIVDIGFNSCYQPVKIWLRIVFLRHWDGQAILAKRSIAASALRILDTIVRLYYNDINDSTTLSIWPYFPSIPARVSAADIARSFMEVSEEDYNLHLLSFPSVFPATVLATYFRTMNHLKMQQAHSESEKASAIRLRHEHMNFDDESGDRLKWMEEHYLLLNISRQNVVQDAFDQVWQRRKTELLRPLRIRLGETNELEIGHDLGGVQIEFFNLLWRELLREEAHLFTTDSSTGLTYFRPGSLQPLYMFELCGLLFGLAVYNGITLPVNFPMAFYGRLTQTREVDISDRWPEVSRSLQMIVDEDISDLEAVFPLEANGILLSVHAHQVPYDFRQIPYCYNISDSRVRLFIAGASRMLHHEPSETAHDQPHEQSDGGARSTVEIDIKSIEEAWPGWHISKGAWAPPNLDAEFKHEYVEDYKRWLVWGSVAPQLAAFEKGFQGIIDTRTTAFLTTNELRNIVEGTRNFDINDLMSVTQYEGYDQNSRYIRSFWHLVSHWPKDKQRQLLKFVTAIERLPSGGASNFTFKIERPRPDEPEKLPTSSTCFRTLYLPKYPTAGVMHQKLCLAFEYGLEGFGTG